MAIGDKKPVLLQEDIGADGGVPPYLHASQHAADGTDPITPAAINAVNKAGDTMDYNSKLKFPLANGKGGAVFALADGVLVQAYADITDDSSNRTGLKLYPDGRAIILNTQDDTSDTYNILHTGNKPSGSYTGNGDATERTIAIGGIGGAVALWSGEWGYGVIYPVGGIIANMNGAKYFGGAEVAYVNGMLTLKSTDNLLNASGVTYYYQVL